jgi:hypothetical protein
MFHIETADFSHLLTPASDVTEMKMTSRATELVTML